MTLRNAHLEVTLDGMMILRDALLEVTFAGDDRRIMKFRNDDNLEAKIAVRTQYTIQIMTR